MRLHQEDKISNPKTASEICKKFGLAGLAELSTRTKRNIQDLDCIYVTDPTRFLHVVRLVAEKKKRILKAVRGVS